MQSARKHERQREAARANSREREREKPHRSAGTRTKHTRGEKETRKIPRDLVENGFAEAAHDVVDGVAQISAAQYVFEVDDHGREVSIHLERSQLRRQSER